MTESKLKENTELRQAVTRLHNITKNAEEGPVSADLFREDAEKALWDAYQKVEGKVYSLYAAHDYAAAMPLLDTLTQPVNHYLDDVMVMDKDEKVRNNRLAMLKTVLALFDSWGDFSKLV